MREEEQDVGGGRGCGKINKVREEEEGEGRITKVREEEEGEE